MNKEEAVIIAECKECNYTSKIYNSDIEGYTDKKVRCKNCNVDLEIVATSGIIII